MWSNVDVSVGAGGVLQVRFKLQSKLMIPLAAMGNAPQRERNYVP